MSRRKPPLEDSRWWLIGEALEHRIQQIDSPELTELDFNRVLKADRLRTMRRRPDGSYERLTASAWDDLYIDSLIIVDTKPFEKPFGRSRMRPGRLVVWSRQLGGQVQNQWIYVWRPDYEKIFSGVTAPSAELRAQSSEVPENGGRKQVHDRADLQSVALWLALQRKQGAPEKRQVDIVGELREWCKRNRRKVPGDSYLNDVVAAALRIKPTLKL